MSVNDTSCVNVTPTYYSDPAAPNNHFGRKQCPSYALSETNSDYGLTTGSGLGADEITDCYVPTTAIYADETGAWSYDQNCYYDAGGGSDKPLLEK
jgi:hypothetical protein